MTTLINKATAKLSASNVVKGDKDLEDKAFIRNIDYDELERRFQVRRYVPNYIHNYDYSTPQIRSMINDKPIYGQANKHVKKTNARKKKTAEFDIVTGEVITKKTRQRPLEAKKELLCDQLQQRKELRKEHRDKRAELRKQYVSDRRSEKEETRRLMNEHRKQRKNMFRDDAASVDAKGDRMSGKEFPKQESSFSFINPFESGQTTLVESGKHPDPPAYDRKNSVSTLHRNGNRKSSLSSTLKGLVLHKRHEEKQCLNLSRTFSYDQTKSIMTTKRDADKDELKLKNSSGRRMSEVTRTYTFLLIFVWCIANISELSDCFGAIHSASGRVRLILE